MKTLVLASLVLFSATAHADNWADNCKNQSKPELVITYPTDILPAVIGGKITATVRKGVRCFQKGDVLVVKDSVSKAVVGNAKLEEVYFSKFNAISPKVVARSAEASMQALHARLITIYGEEIRGESLTELYFSFSK